VTLSEEAELAATRHRYLSSLPEQLARLVGAICVAHDGGEIAEAAVIARRIPSTARTHGLEALAFRIGSIAVRLEALGTTSRTTDWSEVRRALSLALDETSRTVDALLAT